MATYVALLRGINVAGNTRVSMDGLRKVFADLGHEDVKTYLQTGNIVFTAGGKAAQIAAELEKKVAADLGVSPTVLLRTVAEMSAVLDANPYLDDESDHTKLHVTFLAEKPDAKHRDALTRPDGETAEFQLRGREVFLHCPNGYGRTKLNNSFIEKKLGVRATTRNWKTVAKLCELAG
ncbi:DUF1697 domain-containing protein [Paractinoplanes atraurantiacus]|uniref:Uncharacterized conserved protein, DUF1697 family n=1 Tax=Paractinoplanes atraurantiacus TaxID=1036182 RepID=A0A285GLQ1_9ACTN|nr:DUF1697 domain-containing protein [Actinoplanes atraurantiacus]SNY24492.1 Uncharacterized conserved protein, DUF1697 family [Actinoplanes atraurantiacus]